MFGWFKSKDATVDDSKRPEVDSELPAGPAEKIVAALESSFIMNNKVRNEKSRHTLRYYLFESKKGVRSVEVYTDETGVHLSLASNRRDIKVIDREFGMLNCYSHVIVPWLRGTGSTKIPTYKTVDAYAVANHLADSKTSYPIFTVKELI